MTLYTPGTRIATQTPCPDCTDGFRVIPEDPSSASDSTPVIKLYHRGYCPTCGGASWLAGWITIETLHEWLTTLTETHPDT